MQHDERGYRIDAVVAVVGTWVAVHDAAMQRMLCIRPSISIGADAG